MPSKVEKTLSIKTFGELTAIKKARKSFTLCQCSCGTEKVVRSGELLDGAVTHCGCKSDNRTKSVIKVQAQVDSGFRKDMLVAYKLDEEKTTRGRAYCIFKCDCGSNKSFALGGVESLEYGSCGCYKPKEIITPPSVLRVLEKKVFARYTVLHHTKDRYVECICSCGKVKEVRADSLERGDALSCGCFASEQTSKRFKGKFKPDAVVRHPLYRVYHGMLGRCGNENSKDFKWYGG